MILAVEQLKTVIWTIPFLFFLLSIFALLISFGKYGSVGNIAHAHIWYKSSNGYSNRPLPIMEIIHFVMDNLSIKITLIISLFVILKYSKYIYWQCKEKQNWWQYSKAKQQWTTHPPTGNHQTRTLKHDKEINW